MRSNEDPAQPKIKINKFILKKVNIELYKIDYKHSLRTLKNIVLRAVLRTVYFKGCGCFHLFHAAG